MDQYIGDVYRDPIVECGRNALESLDLAIKSDTPHPDVYAYTRILKVPDADKAYWETTTVYETEVLGDIHSDLLRQRDPPAYLQGLLGSLVLAHVAHENSRHARDIPLFSPDKTEFAQHINSLWVMIPDHVRNATRNSGYSLPLHTIRNTTLNLSRPEGSNVWSLNFTHQVNYMLLVGARKQSQAWLTKAA